MEIDRPDLRRQRTSPPRPGTAPAQPGGRLAPLGENASDLVWELNESLVFIYASASFRRVLHYKPAALLGCGAPAFLHPGDAAAVSAEFAGLILGAPSARFLFRIRDGEGRWRWLDCSGKAYRGCDGQARVVFISRDVTRCRNAPRRKGGGGGPAAAAALESQEYFAEQLVQAAGRVRSAVVSLRLDNFRQLHPRSGRPAEERFRTALANLLCEAIPAGGLAAHGGGDEFVLLLYGMTGFEASGLGEEIRSRLAGYRFIDGGAIHAVSVSLGVAEVGGDGNAREALGRARAAGAAARASGKC